MQTGERGGGAVWGVIFWHMHILTNKAYGIEEESKKPNGKLECLLMGREKNVSFKHNHL